jgi:uncharacterized protein YdeI (YjbR/CyaY-like superfamily)
MRTKPVFFETPQAFRQWLSRHHGTAEDLLVGYYKKDSGRPSMTWSESVDEALCFGWIDGVRRRIDDDSYTIRFTRRKPGSTWSSVNLKRARLLIELGRMRPAGLKVFEARRDGKSSVYSYEQKTVELDAESNRLLEKNKTAWTFFQNQPASYRRAASWWIKSAKLAETRVKRLEKLIAHSSQGERLPQFTRKKAGGLKAAACPPPSFLGAAKTPTPATPSKGLFCRAAL